MKNFQIESKDEKQLHTLIKNNRLPHGIILECSDSQKLKQTIQLICLFAVCRSSTPPCRTCNQCQKVLSGNHPDIYTAALKGKSDAVNVEEIRNICTKAYTIPNEAAKQVFILPNADKMQSSAQNAFLKVLEEPPTNIIFILCCESSLNLLATIRSRGVIFNLNTGAYSSEELEKADEISQRICGALTQSRSLPLLKALGAITDRQTAATVLVCFNNHIALALKHLSGYNDMQLSQGAKQLLNINRKSLLQITELINTAQNRLKQNINVNLFTAWFCAQLRSTL